MTDSHPERTSEIVQLADESDLRSALSRLRGSSASAQELWLLERVYDLAIDLELKAGQGPVPVPPTPVEQREAASRTLTAEFRGNPSFEAARYALTQFDFDEPEDLLASKAREVIKHVCDAYLEAITGARAHRLTLDAVELIRDTSSLIIPFNEQMSMWTQELRSISQTNRLLGLIDRLTQRHESLVESVQDAVGDAQKADALIEIKRQTLADLQAQESSRQLSGHFETLAQQERRKGAALRMLSVLALALALVVVLNPSVDWVPNLMVADPESWTALSRHLAITLLLAGGAAYAARLASVHYGFGQWAKSIQIQLDSFQGFIGVVEDPSARDRMREEFGRRVLGAPAQAPEDASAGMTTGDLLQLVTSLRAAADRK